MINEVRSRRGAGAWARVGLVLFGSLVMGLSSMPKDTVLAGSTRGASAKQQGHADAGRSVFNGKGVCYYCHGTNGYRDKLPEVTADTAALIARLNPQPADLRNPKTLHLKTDKQRFRAIREGHPGTGMFPDTTMTNREVNDLLAYLTVLRQQDSKGTSKP